MEKAQILLLVLLSATSLQGQENTTTSYPDYFTTTSYPGCGGYLTGESGYFSTPANWDVYPNNIYCEWNIQSQYGGHIRLTFTQFDLEYKPDCTSDSVQIYDSSYTLLGKICSIESCTMFWSSYGSMRVVFMTDSAVQKKGFQAIYETYFSRLDLIPTTTAFPVQCGDVLTSDSGSFYSPSYPAPYPNNTYCQWEIRVVYNRRIELTFTNFDLEFASGCVYDFVQIYDGDRSLRKLCTNDTTIFLSSSNRMTVIFKSDGSVQKGGFYAYYNSYAISSTAAPYSCGGYLTDSSGTFSSPNYPALYPNNVNCTWEIQVQPGNSVRLMFAQFEVEYVESCSYDLVEIYDGAASLGRICSNATTTFSSSSNNMRVVFTSDGMVQKTGFYAVYESYPTATTSPSTTPTSTGML